MEQINPLEVVPGGLVSTGEWRKLLDPPPQAGPRVTNFDKPNNELLQDSDFGPDELESRTFFRFLESQERIECCPGHVLYEFDSEVQQVFIVESGAFARISGIQVKKGFIPFPHFQISGERKIFGARPRNFNASSTVKELCTCIRQGTVVRILNPWKTLDSISVFKRFSKQLLAEQDALIENAATLGSSGSRLHLLVRSLVNSKSLTSHSDSRMGFNHLISQSMLAGFLGVSDNTLRPYLKTTDYGWEGGQLLVNESFARTCHADAGLSGPGSEMGDSI
jgi:hypothetical protein